MARFDGRPARGVPAYRRIMPHLMRGKNEAAVYFEKRIDLSRTLPWLEARSQATGRKLTVFPLLLHALAGVLHERPRLNRFVSGRRIHQRDGVYLSFAAKKSFDDDAPLAVVKRRFEPGESFDDVTVGKVERAPVVTADGAVEARLAVQLKFTYDERIEDGLYCARALELLEARLADPQSWLGPPAGE